MLDALNSLVDRLPAASVAVIGVPVLDRYLYGATHRISREAPVLIVREESQACAPGGAGNTAANVAGLGPCTYLVGPVGQDAEADLLINACHQTNIHTRGLVRGAQKITTTKTRVLAGGPHTTRQQMLRIDREDHQPPTIEALEHLRDIAQTTIDAADIIIISDYGPPGFSPLWIELARYARLKSRPILVDSRYALMAFDGVTAVTPNIPEAEAALGRSLSSAEAAAQAADEIRVQLNLNATLLTRGQEGMVLVSKQEPPIHIEAIGGEAVDVTGAGDTVIATFASALAVGASPLQAAHLANYAASVVVQQTGTYAIHRDELKAHLTSVSR
ncbi:MAG: bifunctional hydroxymethylpyrimidine kinase/phosphomethylpyrimidine kinase [Myxococcales bacterium]|nr:bifunctional hydroxymethylpyrimidine kinase/phosphomethylpyrimidine kinase [Myxococcales bacterium]